MNRNDRGYLGHSAGVSTNVGACFSDFAINALCVVLLFGLVVFLAHVFVNRTNTVKNMRRDILRIEKENSDLEKQYQYRLAELERQKNSRQILVLAERMGLRPPRGQQVAAHINIPDKGNFNTNEKYLSMVQ